MGNEVCLVPLEEDAALVLLVGFRCSSRGGRREMGSLSEE
jgi:hypothetical protein